MFTELGTKLNRKPLTVYAHWKSVIEPVLTRHKAGTLNVDHKDRIVRYMVSNGLKYPQDVNWGEVANLPQFRGTTGPFLHKQYASLAIGTKQFRYKEMITKDISSDLVLDWHESKADYCKGKKQVARQEALIDYYHADCMSIV